ncbi:MAG: RNA polymerase-binding protein DksA [Gammaproteobacteria bacterium]|nr:RNA polymerase-binding protein DksA [Gammaproteobacteria bacterium]
MPTPKSKAAKARPQIAKVKAKPVAKKAAAKAGKKVAQRTVVPPKAKVVARPTRKPTKPAGTQRAKAAPRAAKPRPQVTKKIVVKKPVIKKIAVKKAPPVVKKQAPKRMPSPASARSPSTQVTALGFSPYQEKKGEAYMSSQQADHFRRVLQAWKRQLMEEVDRTVHHMQDEAANYPDPNDRASQEEEITLELRARDRERKLIKKIDEAITSLDMGDYGYCDICGVEIGIRRLEARPTATQCIDCKILEEIREKQMA